LTVKYTNIRAFEKHLADTSPKHFSDLYLILGKDSFQRKQMVDRLVTALSVEEKNTGLNVQHFDAPDTAIDSLLEELLSFSFFSKKRIVCVQNLDKAPKLFLEKLEAYLAQPNPSLWLILSASALNANTKLYKRIEKAGIILDIPEEKPWEREKSAQEWLTAQAAAAGKRFEPQACLHLVKQIGTDPAVLHQELEKLLCYIGERKDITVQDVSAISAATNVENIWQLGESIFRRDAPAALRISKALLDDGVAFLALLRQLRSQFETEYQVGCILAHGGNGGDVVQQFPYMKGAILEKHMQLGRSYGLEKFKAGLLKIDEIELKAKNSAADSETLNEILIVNLIKI